MMFVGIIIALAAGATAWWLLSPRLGAPSVKPTAESSPEEILKQRLARGEIDENEFHRRMAALHGT